MEGSSKAQIITPRSVTPTNENNAKKKKQEPTPTTTPTSAPAVQSQSNKKVPAKIVKDPSPPPKSTLQSALPIKSGSLNYSIFSFSIFNF